MWYYLRKGAVNATASRDTQVDVNTILSIIGLVATIIGLAIGLAQLWTGLAPLIENKARRRILNERFSKGPYDRAVIEQATKYYIRPKCSNIDPAQEVELRHALIATREDLFTKIDQFIDNNTTRKHLFILADSGTGKTSFILNYYVHNLRRQNKHRIALVHLGSPNTNESIMRIPEQSNVNLFLDALDEDTKAIENYDLRITELMNLCRHFRRVVITCRTQFFPRDEEIPVETGIVKIGPRKAGEKSEYEFWKLYLSPFDDNDISRYIKKRIPFWQRKVRNKALSLAQSIGHLSVRPMLLAHIPELALVPEKSYNLCELYELMIEAWLKRESYWVNPKALREFSELIAVDMYANKEKREMERIPYSEVTTIAAKWNIALADWQISGRSLLNRDAQGNYKFAHRSIMEYLFVLRVANHEVNGYGLPLTDQMKAFFVDLCEPISSYLPRLRKLLLETNVALYGPDFQIKPRLRPVNFKQLVDTSQALREREPRIRKIISRYKIDVLKFAVLFTLTRNKYSYEFIEVKQPIDLEEYTSDLHSIQDPNEHKVIFLFSLLRKASSELFLCAFPMPYTTSELKFELSEITLTSKSLAVSNEVRLLINKFGLPQLYALEQSNSTGNIIINPQDDSFGSLAIIINTSKIPKPA